MSLKSNDYNHQASQKSLKVASLIFGSLRLLGGYEVFTYNLLSQLVARGHEVTLYLPREEVSRHRDFYEQLPMQVRGLAIRTSHLFRVVPWALRGYLIGQQLWHKYDVWQVVGAYPAGYLAAALNPRVPTVLRAYGDDVQVDRRLNYGVRLEEPASSRVARTVKEHRCLVAMSTALADCFRELGVPEERIVSIPNGIDHARLAQPVSNAVVRRRLGIGASGTTLLTVGRNHVKKGYDLIPVIARNLKEEGFVFDWLIVGKDSDRLRGALQAEGVTHCVHTFDEMASSQGPAGEPPLLPSPELVEVFASADILVHPSFIEGFPRVLAEGMAAGCAVVTTDAPGCRDVVADGVTGRVAKAGDVTEIGRAVAELISNPDERRRLAAAGQEQALQFDWSQVVAQYEAVYLQALRPNT